MRNLLILLTAITVSVVGITSVTAQERPALRMGVGDDFPPLTGRDLPNEGLASQIVKRAFELGADAETQLDWMPWSRALEMTRRGNLDGTFPWSKTPEREADFLFSDPFLTNTVHDWMIPERADGVTRLLDLTDPVVCRPLGYANLGVLKKMLEQGRAKRTTAVTMETCFRMLAAGRVDVVNSTMNEAVTAARDAGAGIDRFIALPVPNAHTEHRVLVGKDAKRAYDIITWFNAGLQEMRENGEHDAMLAQVGW